MHQTKHPYQRDLATMVDALLTDIQRWPNGYRWFTSLPQTGRRTALALRHRWQKRLISAFLPPTFLTALLTACLSPEGTPETKGTALYTWLLHKVYRGNHAALHASWLATKGQS